MSTYTCQGGHVGLERRSAAKKGLSVGDSSSVQRISDAKKIL